MTPCKPLGIIGHIDLRAYYTVRGSQPYAVRAARRGDRITVKPYNPGLHGRVTAPHDLPGQADRWVSWIRRQPITGPRPVVTLPPWILLADVIAISRPRRAAPVAAASVVAKPPRLADIAKGPMGWGVQTHPGLGAFPTRARARQAVRAYGSGLTAVAGVG